MSKPSIELAAEYTLANQEYLEQATISPIDSNTLKRFSKLMIEKECYNNSVTAALKLDAKYVVFGVVVFIDLQFACEHCWIEMWDGTHHDATYQVHASRSLGTSDFFSLYKVELSKYLELANELRGIPDMAIDFYALRRSPITDYLFTKKRVM